MIVNYTTRVYVKQLIDEKIKEKNLLGLLLKKLKSIAKKKKNGFNTSVGVQFGKIDANYSSFARISTGEIGKVEYKDEKFFFHTENAEKKEISQSEIKEALIETYEIITINERKKNDIILKSYEPLLFVSDML